MPSKPFIDSMRLSLLHISDLHRDPANPIGNAALLDSLENDRRRYTSEQAPSIRSPDLIIVSGDIVQGVGPNVSDPDKVLKQQYAEAHGFLNELARRFLDGDKQRVIVIPGNHDVSAYHFFKSLRRIDILPDRKKELVTQLFSPNSPLRWSWSDFELHEIADRLIYTQRLAAFAKFYKEFYDGARSYSLDPTEQFDLFDFPQFGLTVAGFCSCYNNDLFNRQGDIHPDCIGAVGSKIRERQYQGRLRIAVWHHNTEGLPLKFDYMDPDIIQNLIDRGFSLGLHGHQHRPQFLDTRFHYQGSRRITVISAGTLCGGPSVRFGRAYNVIELDIEMRTGVLHLREMQNDNLLLPIWGRRSLPPHTKEYLEFHFDPPPEPIMRVSLATATLIEAEKLYNAGDYRKAAEMLADGAQSDDLARRLFLDCLIQLADMPAIISHFDPPVSETEAIYVMDALWSESKRDRLLDLLRLPIIANTTDPSLIEIRDKYGARLQHE
jgi:predicted MPP superfamily phosphohydrolase